MRIDEALGEVKPLAVKFGPAVLNIEYRPPSYTIEQLEAAKADAENPDRLVRMVQDLIVGWDLTRPLRDDEGNVVLGDNGASIEVPVDVTNADDVRKYVTTTVINGITVAVREDNKPGEA